MPDTQRDLTPMLADMRLHKDADELATMRRAAAISAGAHARAMRFCAARFRAAPQGVVREYEIEAELLHEFRRHGAQKTTVLEHRGIRLDLLKREATLDGAPVTLTQREFALLELFLQNPGRVLTRTQIAEKIWDCHFDMETNLVDVYVAKLRGKLKRANETEPLFHSVRGVGYKFA